MSIHELIHEVALCTKCKAPRGLGCTCWVQLQCPDCGERRSVRRDDSDPEAATLVVYACPQCRDTEPEDVRYFDEHGTEIVPDEES